MKNLIKTFFLEKNPPWSISTISESNNETYNKPPNLPHSFGNLGRNIVHNIYVLLLIITLRFTFTTKENFGEWLKSSKILWIQTFRNGVGRVFFFSQKMFLLNLRPWNVYTFFEYYLVFAFLIHFLLLIETRATINEFYSTSWVNRPCIWCLNVLAKLPVFFSKILSWSARSKD